jgi:hypothetical protein
MGLSFFSPKGRMNTSRPAALLLNTMNMLGPALLLVAVGLLLTSWTRSDHKEVAATMNQWAGALVMLALLVRVIWGLAIWRLRRTAARDADST